jgi:single-stranded-DNA-specific exonuclease
MERNWELMTPDPAAVAGLRAALGCHPVLAAVLVNRGVTSPEQADAFLNPSLSRLRPPTGLQDLEKAVRRIGQAILGREKILLFGDYDVDGATATVVLLEFLKACGAPVSYYIPHRVEEGYGFQPAHVARAVIPSGARLMITVDCGSGSREAVAAANAAGIDVIVTDHHNLPPELPDALAVVNPKRPDCRSGLAALAGVGVAFCLVIALRRHLREMGFWSQRPEPNLKALCDLVALGTLTDMVPLVEDNRILTRAGIELIREGGRPGLVALSEASGISGRSIDSDDIAYRLGPRLNAAGRIDHASRAVELLTAPDLAAARRTASALNALNVQRQALERDILAEIEAVLRREPERLQRRALVLARPGWHDGVLGIAASKVMDRYFRPVVLIGLRDGFGRGSARSIPGIDVFACLSACREHLQAAGGHSQAAGLRLAADRVPHFSEAFEEAVRRQGGADAFVPRTRIDAVLDFEAIDAGLADALERLMPFGNGNPEPVFMAKSVSAIRSAPAGSENRRLVLVQPRTPAGAGLKAVQFNRPHQPHQPLAFDRIAFRLRWNRWNGHRSLQLLLEATSPR